MTENSDESATVHTQLKQPKEQKERWRGAADALDVSLSEFIRDMVESGMKPFFVEVERDESVDELREQRNDLRNELQHSRARIKELEDRLYRGERATVERYVNENPGATFGEIVQHLIDTAPERVNRHLDELATDSIRYEPESNQYYPRDEET